MCYLFWDEICKIIRKREGEKIMKRLTVIFMAICMTLITACGSKSEEVGKGERVEFSKASYESSQTVEAELVYCDNEKFIFKDVYGLFIYSFKENKMLNSLDVKKIGCDMNQGDDTCFLKSYGNGKIIKLYTAGSDGMEYYFDWEENALYSKLDLSGSKEDTKDNLSEYRNKETGELRYSYNQADTPEGTVTLVCKSGMAEDVEYIIEKNGSVMKNEKIFG